MPGAYPCSECKKLLRWGKNKEGKWYWGCFNTEAHTSGKPVFLNDTWKPAPWFKLSRLFYYFDSGRFIPTIWVIWLVEFSAAKKETHA